VRRGWCGTRLRLGALTRPPLPW